MIPISSLQPGQRFRLAALEKEGVLVQLGEGAAAVRYGGVRHVALPNGREFDAKGGEVVTISLATEVIPLEGLGPLPSGEPVSYISEVHGGKAGRPAPQDAKPGSGGA